MCGTIALPHGFFWERGTSGFSRLRAGHVPPAAVAPDEQGLPVRCTSAITVL